MPVAPKVGARYDCRCELLRWARCGHFGPSTPQAEIPLRVWYAEASRAGWKGPRRRQVSPSQCPSFLANNRVVFNIKGNNYRLVVAVHYNRGMMFIRFVGTHAEYDRIDATTI